MKAIVFLWFPIWRFGLHWQVIYPMLFVVWVGMSRSCPECDTPRRRYLAGGLPGSRVEWAWWILPPVKDTELCRVAGDVDLDLGVRRLLSSFLSFWKGFRLVWMSSLSDACAIWRLRSGPGCQVKLETRMSIYDKCGAAMIHAFKEAICLCYWINVRLVSVFKVG